VKAYLSYKNLRKPSHRPMDVETWFLHPPILLRVRLQPVLHRLILKGPTIRVLLVGTNNYEPRSIPLKPKISLVLCWT